MTVVGLVVALLAVYMMYKFPFCKLVMAATMCGIGVDNFETNGRSMCAMFWMGIDIIFLFYVFNLMASFCLIIFIVGYGILSTLTLVKLVTLKP